MVKQYVKFSNMISSKKRELKESENGLSGQIWALIGVILVILVGFVFKDFLFTTSLTLTVGGVTATGNGLVGWLTAYGKELITSIGK